MVRTSSVQVHVVNLVGFAFDSSKQPDYAFFMRGRAVDQEGLYRRWVHASPVYPMCPTHRAQYVYSDDDACDNRVRGHHGTAAIASIESPACVW